MTSQVTIHDVGPRVDTTTSTVPGTHQSVSGKALCVALSADGQRVYLGGHSGIWRSDDGAATWAHLDHAQPVSAAAVIPGGLPVPNVYDLLVSPADPDLVIAATSSDSRRPPQHGVYRSTNGGKAWTRVHQCPIAAGASIRPGAGCLAVAPDDARLMFAAGHTSIAVSNDAGASWTDFGPPGELVRHVVVGPSEGAIRRVYAAGPSLWYSTDGALTWRKDPGGRSLPFPGDESGVSSRAMAIHPANPTVVYLMNAGALFRGDFSRFDTTGRAQWRQLPSLKADFDDTTASGGDFIAAHIAPDGTFYLIASDRRSVGISIGEPTSTSDWDRIDGDPLHVDPHNIALTAQFSPAPQAGQPSSSFGRIVMVNDGGVNFSTDGMQTWEQGEGLATLGLVNAAVLPRAGQEDAIAIGTGDNNGFFSDDGGTTWKTLDRTQGDNGPCWSDRRQPSRLFVSARRVTRGSNFSGIYLYETSANRVVDGAKGTSHRKKIPGPPPVEPGDDLPGWNVTTKPYNRGYRPVVETLDGQAPRPGGDFIAIRYSGSKAMVVRTTEMGKIRDAEDWVTTATQEGQGAKAFQQGPDLPTRDLDVVQASGGHDEPVFYVGDPDGAGRVWKWAERTTAWQQLVPGPPRQGVPTPGRALRFFVDPFRPSLIYVLDEDAVLRSDDGGETWVVDEALGSAMTADGAFPFDIPNGPNHEDELIRDVIFDPADPLVRFAVGPAGVFMTEDGVNWGHLLVTSAMPMRPNNGFYVPHHDPEKRALYVSTNNRGILRITYGIDNLGGSLTSGPAVAHTGSGRLEVFIRGVNNELVQRSFNGTKWSGWKNLGGQLASSAPAVVHTGSGRLEVFIRGIHNELVQRSFDGKNWGGWKNLGGSLTSGPAVARAGSGRLEVFIRGVNNELVQRSFDGKNWGGWKNLGGSLTSGPAVAHTGSGRLELFIRGSGDQLVQRSFNGTKWSGWKNLGGQLASGPAVAHAGSGRLEVFIRGEADDKLVQRSWNGSAWSGWRNLGGQLASGPAVAFVTDSLAAVGRLEVLLRGSGDQLLHRSLMGPPPIGAIV